MRIKFLRTTHDENGNPKEFSVDAKSIWNTFGFVGHMLDPKTPMTIEEIYRAIIEYNEQNPDDPCKEYENINSVVEALGELISSGMITAIISFPMFDENDSIGLPLSFETDFMAKPKEEELEEIKISSLLPNNWKEKYVIVESHSTGSRINNSWDPFANKKLVPISRVGEKRNGEIQEFKDNKKT